MKNTWVEVLLELPVDAVLRDFLTDNGLTMKSITVLSPSSALKLDCTAMASSDQRCVTDLLQDEFPNENPLNRGWLVMAAHINLYSPPEPGKMRPKVVTIEVTRKGRLNLHKFDAEMQAQLEGYLVTLGILQPGQTLSAHETPPDAEATNQQPVYEE